MTRSSTRSPRDHDRRIDGAQVLARPPDGQGEGRSGDRAERRKRRSCSSAPSAAPTGSSMQLQKEGVRVSAIHGDLRQTSRQRALDDFSKGRLPGARRHRRGGKGSRHRGRRRRRALRPSRGPQGLCASLRAHRPCGGQRSSRNLLLWDQVTEIERIQKRLGLKMPIVEIFSNDPQPGGPCCLASRRGSRLSTATRPLRPGHSD